MKTIIAGSRDASSESTYEAIGRYPWIITGIVSGLARGPDSYGLTYAEYRNIPTYTYPADWNKHGKAAGHIRNRQMAENAEALIAVWDGLSRGTKNMIDEAKRVGLQIYIYRTDELHNI